MSGPDTLRGLESLDVAGRRALVRVDFNVPVKDGAVADDSRIREAQGTVDELIKRGAAVVLLSHRGRPGGARDETLSLRPVVDAATRAFGRPVRFAEVAEADEACQALQAGDILLLENLRFEASEEDDDEGFARRLADLGDVYVNDAFSASHRAHASVHALSRLLPAAAGRALEREVAYLVRALSAPERPVLAIVGGAKVSTKLKLLKNLSAKVDMLAVGGGMANTFFAAQGFDMKASLAETALGAEARAILDAAERAGCKILLPTDVVVARELAPNATRRVTTPDALQDGDMILDAGPETVDRLADAIDGARTVLWNGPLGAFETPPFDTATVEAARYCARRCRDGALTAIAGGGDTVAALNAAGVTDSFDHVSTAGGAFLQWLEGRPLPGVKALEAAAAAA